MKSDGQPNKDFVSWNFQCTNDPRWLNNVFLFSTEIWAEQLQKNTLWDKYGGPYLLNPKLVSISDFHFNSKLKTVQMKLMKASSKPSACLPYLLVSPAWLSRDLNRLSSLLQRQLPSFTQCTHVISIWGGWGSGLWWWWIYHDFDDQSTLTLQQCLCWRFLLDVVFPTS